MKYYSINVDNSCIGVISSSDFYQIQRRNKILLPANETNGQYVIYKNTFYRDIWMSGVNNDSSDPFQQAIILEITEEEYNSTKALIESNDINDTIDNSDEESTVEVSLEPINAGATISLIQEEKIKELNRYCHNTIEEGVDVILSDNQTHHFSLTTQDQLNLITLSSMLDTTELIPYHADGELCNFYTAEDMKAIIAAATQHKIYHTTYFNAAKNYINHLNDNATILAFHYGDPIPEQYQTDVLRSLTNE